MDIVAWIRPWDGDVSDLGNMIVEPVIDGDTTPPADNHEWVACVLHSDALAAIEQARREEREACAKIADEAGPGIVAERIRARGDSLLANQQHLPADIAKVLADAGDSLIERDHYTQEELDAADKRAEALAARLRVE